MDVLVVYRISPCMQNSNNHSLFSMLFSYGPAPADIVLKPVLCAYSAAKLVGTAVQRKLTSRRSLSGKVASYASATDSFVIVYSNGYALSSRSCIIVLATTSPLLACFYHLHHLGRIHFCDSIARNSYWQGQKVRLEIDEQCCLVHCRQTENLTREQVTSIL